MISRHKNFIIEFFSSFQPSLTLLKILISLAFTNIYLVHFIFFTHKLLTFPLIFQSFFFLPPNTRYGKFIINHLLLFTLAHPNLIILTHITYIFHPGKWLSLLGMHWNLRNHAFCVIFLFLTNFKKKLNLNGYDK